MNSSDGKVNFSAPATRVQTTQATKTATVNAYKSGAASSAKSNKETSNVTHPAASLELSQEGVQMARQAQAREQLAAVKERLSETQLDQVHSNLRVMRVNHLLLD